MIFLGETGPGGVGWGVIQLQGQEWGDQIPSRGGKTRQELSLELGELFQGAVGDGVVWGQGLCWVAKCTGGFA